MPNQAESNKNDPKTEIDYYLEILALEKSIKDMTGVEGFSWKTPGNEEKFRKLQREIASLEKEVHDLFANPNSLDIYSWKDKIDFQLRMEHLYLQSICSACIFSQGLDVLINERRVPCEMHYKGLRVNPLHLCGHIKDKKMTLDKLCYSIKYVSEERKEPAALYLFLKKMVELNNGYYGGIEKFLLDNLREITNG